MIEERAMVVQAGDGYAWIEIQRRSACGACAASEGCGTAVLGKLWSGRRIQVRAIAEEPLRAGDEVCVGLAEGVLLRGALLAYSLPLLLLLAGALLGQAAFAGAGEEPVVLSGALGLGLGFLAVRVLSKRFRDDIRFQPRVLRRTAEAPVAMGVLSLP
ncbi:MAG: SoxR reducing system RseC family protein [Candidatus Competibacter sp.]|nr:SoxR reducing system RseC family protein [Candidatus Competibacter sp.]MDG4582472.1 SoxR reducing system RseC family protein [Candidatus Competibacter sp.]